MKAYSPEWYAREQIWADECNTNFETVADGLVAQGYTRKNHNRRWYPSTFHKGETTLVLVRQLGCSTWYSRTYAD